MTESTPDTLLTVTPQTPSPSRSTTRPSSHARWPVAWRSRAAWLTLLVSCLLSIALDLGSKAWAFHSVIPGTPVRFVREDVLAMRVTDPRDINGLIPHHKPRVVVPTLLELTLVLNPGAVFGIGPGKRMFFVGFTIIALGFGLLMFARGTHAIDRLAHVGIGMVIGGGLGNLYDRLFYGCVRDFLHPLPDWKWPFGIELYAGAYVWPYVSNGADLFLLIGIVLLLVHLWKKDRAERRASVQARSASEVPSVASDFTR